MALDDTQVESFKILKSRLCSGKPKLFVADTVKRPTLLFTDGALEYDGQTACGTIGAVCIHPDGRTEVFGVKVSSEVLGMWQQSGKTHVIGLVELYACVVSLVHWKRSFATRRVIMFVDNWPALDVIVKGTSLEKEWRSLLLVLESLGDDMPMLWVARVPSSSNAADHPSRGTVEPLKFLEPFKCVSPLCPIMGIPLENIIAEADGGD